MVRRNGTLLAVGALAVAVAMAGCNGVIGVHDFTHDATTDGVVADGDPDGLLVDGVDVDGAVVDGPLEDGAIDGAMIDAAMIDAAMIDAAPDAMPPLDGPPLGFATAITSFQLDSPGVPITINQSRVASAQIFGTPGDLLNYVFASTVGTIAPMTGSVVLGASGQATIAATYTAPATPSSTNQLAVMSAPASATLAVPVLSRVTYGHDVDYAPGTTNGLPDRMLGAKITVTAGYLEAFGIWVQAGGAHVQFGLYADSGNAPGALVASLPAVTLAAGRNEFSVAGAQLGPGDYWLAAIFDVDVAPGAMTGGASDGYFVRNGSPFASPMPGSLVGDSNVITGNMLRLAYYLVLAQ